MNLAHLVRACNFKFSFLQSSFICFLKVKLLSIVIRRDFSLELPSITELLILTDFELKGDQNKVHFEAFGTSHSIFVNFGYLVIFFGICSVIVIDYIVV